MNTQSNLTATMQHFGNLTETERELFLSVITTKNVKAPVKTQKRKKKQLSPELSEEAQYQRLISTHNEKVRKRIARLKNKQKGQLASANK